jgi:AraC-like DNA-binding protein
MSTNLSANVTTSDGLDLPGRHQQALYAGDESALKQIRANAVKQTKEQRGKQAAEWQKRAFSQLDKAFMQGFMQGGGPVSANGVSANDQRLDFDEFEDRDEDTLEEVRFQLGITDALLSAGFSTNTSLARTVYVQERESKWEQGGEISMDGRAKSNDDEAVLEIFGTPVTICHVDYEISARQQQQSQNFGEDIETRKARQAGRILRETEEFQTLDGWGPTVEDARGNTLQMYGMRDSNVSITGSATGDWGTPSNVLDTIDDILNQLETQTADNNRGPMPEEQGMWLWYHPNQRSDLRAADPRGDGNMSLMSRIERDYPYIEMQANGALDDGELVAMVQDQRFGEVLNAQAPTNLSEEVDFGFATKYKALSARVPFFKKTYDGVKGITYYTGA